MTYVLKAEDPDLVPGTHARWLTTVCDTTSRESPVPSCALHRHCTRARAHTQKHTQLKMKSQNKFFKHNIFLT